MRIELKCLQHTYSSGTTAIDGVDLILEGTDPIAVIGQNGSGKTTLAKHLNGILRPTDGELLIDGVSIAERTTAEWSKRIGYVFQNPDDQLFLETVRKELSFGPRQIGLGRAEIDSRLERVGELIGLSKKLEKHPFDLTSTEKKFCTIGAVMMMNPDVFVFDEPTCGQDSGGNRRLQNILRELRNDGKLCITISHDMPFVTENFPRIVVMHQGKILIDGNAKDVFSQPEVLKLSHVSPPPITRVAQMAGVQGTPFTVAELIRSIHEERSHRENG